MVRDDRVFGESKICTHIFNHRVGFGAPRPLHYSRVSDIHAVALANGQDLATINVTDLWQVTGGHMERASL